MQEEREPIARARFENLEFDSVCWNDDAARSQKRRRRRHI